MFIKYLAWSTNPCNFQNMGVNSHIMEKALENKKQFSSPSLPYRFKVNENSCNPKCLGMYEFP